MTSLDAGDRIGIALGWLAGALILPWFWLAHGVLRILEKLNSLRSWGLGLAILASMGCPAHMETQRSRDILECVYQVQYVGPKLSPAAEAAAVKRCRE